MAKNFKLSNAAKSTAANAVVDMFDDISGTLVIYDGTQPATPDTAITTQTVLATVNVDVAFGAAANGVAVTGELGTIVVGSTGTATWFRMFDSGNSAICDGTVGATNDYDLTLSSASLTANDEISGLTLTYTQSLVMRPNGTTDDSPAPDSADAVRECVERLREHEHRSIRDAQSCERAHALMLTKLDVVVRELGAVKATLLEHERRLSLWGFIGAAAGTVAVQLALRMLGGH